MNRSKSAQSGFTLVEMLVVFVMVGLISVLLLEGYVYVLSLRGRFVAQTEFLQQGILKRQWFVQSVQGLIADIPSLKRHDFQGQPTEFSGLSTAALTQLPGVPAVVSWRLISRGDSSFLQYRSRVHGWWTVLQWPGSINSGFRYWSSSNDQWYSRWPPRVGKLDEPLPAAIAVSVEQDNYRQVWVASPIGARRPRSYLRVFSP